jgi:GNAT superfamily N-acetyltransferase
MKGQGGGGTARGGGKSSSSGKDVVIKKSKAMQTKAINENILKLRAALFDDQGKDKNILEGIAASFLNYDRNGLSVNISFSPKLEWDEFEWAFSLSQDNMEEIYDASGYGWDDEDKKRELTEQGARFLLIKDNATHELKGYIHFRFTVQGEVLDQMVGQPCLYVMDMHLVEDIQRKGLGKHLLVILELIARRQQMSRVTFPIYIGDEKTKAWLVKQGKGYESDESFGLLGFDADAEVSLFFVCCSLFLFLPSFSQGFEVYSKVFSPPPVQAPAVVNAVPANVLTKLSVNAEKEIKNNSETTSTSNNKTPVKAAVDEKKKSDEEPDEIVVNMDEIISELKALYVQQHHADPTEEIIEMWKNEVNTVKEPTPVKAEPLK